MKIPLQWNLPPGPSGTREVFTRLADDNNDRKRQSKHTIDRFNPQPLRLRRCLTVNFQAVSLRSFVQGGLLPVSPSTGQSRSLLIGWLPRTNPNVFSYPLLVQVCGWFSWLLSPRRPRGFKSVAPANFPTVKNGRTLARYHDFPRARGPEAARSIVRSETVVSDSRGWSQATIP